jgi:hypothetical protein
MECVVTSVVEKRLGALPVAAEFLRRLDVAGTVDRLCPGRDIAHLTHGQVIEALVAIRLTAPAPLWRVDRWAGEWAVEEVFGIEPELLNDDRLGRALDAIAPHLTEITDSVGARAISEFGIDVSTFHWDSMSLYGAYPAEDQDEEYPRIKHADAAQETIMELLWQVWPICSTHKIGLHPRPAGTTDGWYQSEADSAGPPVWWCQGGRDGTCHDVSLVGELAATLPGKQRRALRRSERKQDGRR